MEAVRVLKPLPDFYPVDPTTRKRGSVLAAPQQGSRGACTGSHTQGPDGTCGDCGAPLTNQARVVAWVRHTLGDEELRNRPVRALRFAEEAIELAQACGVDASALHKLVDYVFSRPVGEPSKELGGCLLTLYTVAETLGVSLNDEFETELVRVHSPEVIERVRRRQAEKREVTT